MLVILWTINSCGAWLGGPSAPHCVSQGQSLGWGHWLEEPRRLHSRAWCLGAPPRSLCLALAWVSLQPGSLGQGGLLMRQLPKVSIARGAKVEATNLLQPILRSYTESLPLHPTDQSSPHGRRRLRVREADPTSQREVRPKSYWEAYLIHHRNLFRYFQPTRNHFLWWRARHNARVVHLRTALTENIPAHKHGLSSARVWPDVP